MGADSHFRDATDGIPTKHPPFPRRGRNALPQLGIDGIDGDCLDLNQNIMARGNRSRQVDRLE